jgi:hypothetical protein
LVISLIAYHINSFYNLNKNIIGVRGYGIIFLLIFSYFVIHYSISVLLATVLNFEKLFNKIVYDKVNYFNNLILWILPILIIYTYSNILEHMFFKVLLIFLTILLTIRYSLLLYNNKNLIFNNIFYFILYLCALEISPLVIILKLTN